MRALALLLLLAACATPEEAARVEDQARAGLERELAGLTPGEPSQCLPVTARQQLSSRGYGSTIVYRVGSGLKYRSDTTGGCERLARNDILVTRTPLSRPCSGDIATTIDRQTGFQTGSCAFGPFVPYRRP